MTAPAGVVDLSLPDYATLIAAAGVDPDAEAARVAGANPADVAGVGAAFANAGGELDTAWSQSMNAQTTLGAAFTNNGAPVLDRATHVANLPAGFREAGTRLAGASTRMAAVGTELTATMSDTATTVTGLHGDLQGIRAQWAARVAAAGTAEGGLIPEAAIPGLLAERDRIAVDMTIRVGDAGRRVTARIRGYEVVINDAVRLLADQGFVPPQDLDVPPPAAPTPATQVDPTGFGTPLMAGYAADPVNTALGNFVEVETDLPYDGLLAGLSFARTYNSRSDRTGPFGPRWSSWAGTRLTDRTWTAEFEGPDGQRVSFPRSGSGFARVVGISALAERGETGLVLAWFDGRRWDFDVDGRLVRTWAGPGTGVSLRYDDRGRLSELAHDRGRRVLVDWDPEHDRIVAVTGSDGRQVGYRYDEAGQLVEAATPGGARHYGIDAAGLIESVTDADGVIELVNTYDARGRVLTQRSAFGRLVTFGYHPDEVTVVADDSAGPRNTYHHDRAGRLLSITDGHGHSQHKRYDRWGNPVEIVERGGAITRQEFDHRGHLIRRDLPSGAVYTADWDEHDRVVAVTAAGAQIATATTRFRYDGAERTPAEITDPEGGSTRISVADGSVVAFADADGVTVRFRHDPDGNLVEAVDAAGGTARIERDAAGRATAVVTPSGRRTELTYDPSGLLLERRDPAGGVWRHEYSAAGRPTATIDPTGARTETRYGPHGEAVELIDALGAVTTRRFDVFGNLTDLVAPDGAKWAFTHDALSRLTAWTDPAGGTWLHEHDADGHRTASTDPTGVRESAGYDRAGRITSTDDGLVTRTLRYDELGRAVAQDRADGVTLHARYDRCGRRVADVGPDGSEVRYDHSPAGRLLRVVAASGRDEHYSYDPCGRLVTRTDGNSRSWQLRHDADGLLVERISPTGLVETITRDAVGRVVSHRVPGRGTTLYSHDAAGRLVAVADRAGRREFTHDAAGRVVTASDALGHTTHHTYDDRGRLVTIVDPLGARTERSYDELGRVLAETDPLGRTTRFGYDAAGRLLEHRDPTGARRLRSYDTSGRTARIAAVPPDRSAVASVITIERDVLGQPVRVSGSGPDAGDPVELRWDLAGRLVERRTGGRTLRWAYDADGLRVGMTHPDGTTTRYRRDLAGHVVAVQHPLLGTIALDRDPDGRLLAMSSTEASTRWRYTDGWLSAHQCTHGARRRSTRLTRDDHGRVVAADTDGRLRMFDYDAAGQLVGAADPDGQRTYTYDAAGRLTDETGPSGRQHFEYDAAGQLLAVDDPDGHRTFGYDAAGRRRSERGPAGGDAARERDYTYDGFGRLAGIHTAGHGEPRTTRLHLDALNELAGIDDVPVAWDAADPTGPLAALGDENVVGYRHPWAVTDAATRAHRVLDTDWQGSVGGDNDPWGTAAERPGLGYRGELAVDGLIWLRNRAYDPATRAFLQTDPLAPVSGTAYAANPYHYAGNDPVNALDPDGRRPVTDADVAGQRDEGGGWLSDLGHGVLDVVGLVPVVGEVADVANAGWYAAEGDYLMAGLSLAAAVPLAGWGATGAKLAIKGGRAIGTEVAEQAAARTLAERVAVTGTQAARAEPAADSTIAVIGRQYDTAVARDWPGHEILDLPRGQWSLERNDAWVSSVVDRKLEVYVGSPTAGNLVNPVTGSPTVFSRELDQLRQAGYTPRGDSLLPPGAG